MPFHPKTTILQSIAHNSINIKRGITLSAVPCLTIRIGGKEDQTKNIFIQSFPLRIILYNTNTKLILNSKKHASFLQTSFDIGQKHASAFTAQKKASGGNMN